jgi:hypothetical protein
MRLSSRTPSSSQASHTEWLQLPLFYAYPLNHVSFALFIGRVCLRCRAALIVAEQYLDVASR